MNASATNDPDMHSVAIGWALAIREPDFARWEDFAEWLEADPAHAAAYDAVQLALEDADAALAAMPAVPEAPEQLPAANDNPAGWLAARRVWLGGAVAAAAALMIGITMWSGPQGAIYRTAPGETRMIALEDGSTVELAGGSALVVESPRSARLDGGQALFTIRHDAARPFVLMAGGTRLVDAGTVFDVRLAGEGALELAVSEGAVVVDPEAAAVRVDAGQRAVRTGGRTRVSPVDPATVGEWRRGRITFDQASLAEIAAELARATGQPYASKDRALRLSGSIATDPLRRDPRSVEALLGVRVRAEGERWVIEAP